MTELADVEATFTVSGSPAQVGAFRKLLTAIDLVCRAGASRTIEVAVDGDGATSLSFSEAGVPLSRDLTLAEQEFLIWPQLRSSKPADAPPSFRDYAIGWRWDGARRVLAVELDGSGPPHETGEEADS